MNGTGDDPDIGFTEGGYDSATDTGLDRPFLNAIHRYTHIVTDGLTEVTRGAIECELDGGTLQLAMYDITDGVVEAPRVFRQEITLPEEPVDDGYEVGTHTFDIDPVGLQEYVGRELAVAVRHDTVRLRGQNWADEFRTAQGWGIATGEREGELTETWQHELDDSGSAISAALFVEPVDIPDGKRRTVVGSERFEIRSQTVFAAFPDITAESGMVVEYDDRTAADAPVTVHPNGVVEVGQGSSATDSFDVSVRDSEDTWHGPRTITLSDSS